MILMIDNYDSFTYNLVQYLGELGQEIKVFRNDKITIEEIEKMNPDRMIISPGPGSPKDAGISKEAITVFGPQIPVLGVCLGHQCIGEVFGGNIVRGDRIMHGKTSAVFHNEKDIFKGLHSPFEATRYHSLLIEKESINAPLEITAWTEEGEVMGIKHTEFPVWGVQFHPESILTSSGKELLNNFLHMPCKGEQNGC